MRYRVYCVWATKAQVLGPDGTPLVEFTGSDFFSAAEEYAKWKNDQVPEVSEDCSERFGDLEERITELEEKVKTHTLEIGYNTQTLATLDPKVADIDRRITNTRYDSRVLDGKAEKCDLSDLDGKVEKITSKVDRIRHELNVILSSFWNASYNAYNKLQDIRPGGGWK